MIGNSKVNGNGHDTIETTYFPLTDVTKKSKKQAKKEKQQKTRVVPKTH